MPEQPQWSERTLDMPPQDPWAEQPTAPSRAPSAPPAAQSPLGRTAAFPAPETAPFPGEAPSPFTQGRARVTPRDQERHTADHEPTGTGWPGAESPAPPRGMSWRWSELRRGSEWTTAAVLFAFVCWGIWAISEGGSLVTPSIVFIVTLAVAVGVFCLARVVGYLVLERQLGRVRRSARGSHLVTALFLAGVGIGHLRMTDWVMTAWNWVAGQAGG
jgi:hypothetical protein